MRLILTHENADFDAIAALLAAHKLHPNTIPMLPRRINRNVAQFLTLYWDAYPFLRPEDWQRRRIDDVLLVDTHSLNSVRGMVNHPSVHVIDHHLDHKLHESWTYQLEPVGATVTILTETLQSTGQHLSPEEATLLLLGIYEDTGSGTYDTTTSRDLAAAAWLLKEGANLTVVRRFLNIPFTPSQQELFDRLHAGTTWHEIHGQMVLIAAALAPDPFTDEIASVAHRLREALAPAALFVLVQLQNDVQLVARSSTVRVDVAIVAKALGGGGHNRAAAARIRDTHFKDVSAQIVDLLPTAVKPMVSVEKLMSYGVQTMPPNLPVAAAAEQMVRFSYEGYPVFDEEAGTVVGLLTRRAVDRAMSHHMHHLPIERIMKTGRVTVRPSTSIQKLQQIMLAEGWGQVPVLAETSSGQMGRPIGIVTRTDLLNYLFKPPTETGTPNLRKQLIAHLSPPLWQLIQQISTTSAALRLPVYLVGGPVRDLLLKNTPTDLDLVVEGDAITLADHLKDAFGGQIRTHKRFGTAKWMLETAVWELIRQKEKSNQPDDDPSLPSNLLDNIDFVTARTEFYQEPTALPQVEKGSIKLDLHRRDFTINTLAIRLDGSFLGQLLDFYGGQRDLEQGLIRVLHSLSFVDDPTRIIRAVRQEQRLEFRIEQRTVELLQDALPLLDRVSGTRIRHEIELNFREENPIPVMNRLQSLRILDHLFPGLVWNAAAVRSSRRILKIIKLPLWKPIWAKISPEFVYFALWMLTLSAEIREGAMRRMKVRKSTIADVHSCVRLGAALVGMSPAARPSEVSRLLRTAPQRALLVCRIWQPAAHITTWIEQFITVWSQQETALTGHHLRSMGLKPGPLFAEILDALLDQRLDGNLQTKAEEMEYVARLLEEKNMPAEAQAVREDYEIKG